MIFKTLKYAFILIFSLVCLHVLADTDQLGDLAPRGATDGQLNAGDIIIMQRIITGDITATPDEQLKGDVAPLGAPADGINAADLLILQRAVLGDVTLGTINLATTIPVLDAVVSPTNTNPYPVSGTATPGNTVTVYVDGVQKGVVVADLATGIFSASVVLAEGNNNIYAIADDGVDFSPQSTTVIVDFQYIDGGTLSGALVTQTLNTNTRYSVIADITLAGGQTLTLEQGAKLEFAVGTGITVQGSSAINLANLVVNGTPAQPVVFTSATQLPGSWTGIELGVFSSSTIDNAVIEYADIGVHYNSYNGNASNNFTATLSNSTVRNNNKGVRIYWFATPTLSGNQIYSNTTGIEIGSLAWNTGNVVRPVINNNEIYNNSSLNLYTYNTYNSTGTDNIINVRDNWWGVGTVSGAAATIYDFSDPDDTNSLSIYRAVVDFSGFLETQGGSSNQGEIMPAEIVTDTTYNSGTVYVYAGVQINASATLTLNPGVVVQMFDGTGITVQGSSTSALANLVVSGTPSQPVVFTSVTALAGSWTGIELGVFSNSTIDNAVIEYADIGVHYNNYNGNASNNFTATLSNSTVRNNNKGVHIYWFATPTLSGNQIYSNTTGIEIGSLAWNTGNVVRPVINNNEIYNNSNLNLYTFYTYTSGTNNTIDARDNWWGVGTFSGVAATIYDASDPNDANSLSIYRAVVDFNGYLDIQGGVGQPEYMPPVINTDTTYNSGVMQVVSDVLVSPGVTLTINAGAEMRLMGDYVIELKGSSPTNLTNLVVNGTPAQPVVFTSATQLPGSWTGIELGVYSNSTIDNAVIEYADIGVHYNNYNGNSYNSFTATLSNSTLRNNNKGVRIYFYASPTLNGNQIYSNTTGIEIGSGGFNAGNVVRPVINNNEIHNNSNLNLYTFYTYTNGTDNTINARDNWWGVGTVSEIAATIYDANDPDDVNSSSIYRAVVDFSGFLDAQNGSSQGEIMPTTILTDTTYNNGTVYVYADVQINANATLTLNAGVVVQMSDGTSITVQGSAPTTLANLVVNGTPAQPVMFTSATALRGSWAGIELGVFSNSTIDNAMIEYADIGVHYNNYNGNSYNSFTATLSNSTLRNNNKGVRIYFYASPTLNGNQIYSNTTGIEIGSGGFNAGNVVRPVINNNEIYNNSNLNLYTFYTYTSGTDNTINARDNWWGVGTAPEIAATIYDANDPDDANSSSIYRAFVDFGGALDGQNGIPLQIYVEQSINTSTAFSGGVYFVGSNSIDPGAVITVTAGTTFRFFDNAELVINTDVSLAGTSADRISFIPAQTGGNRGVWAGIKFAANTNPVLSYCLISGAVRGVWSEGAAGTVDNCVITNNQTGVFLSGDAGNTIPSSTVFTNNIISDNDIGIEFFGYNLPVNVEPGGSFTGNDIYSNDIYNVRFSGVIIESAVIQFLNNWWGTTDIAAIESTFSFVSSNLNGSTTGIVSTLLPNVSLSNNFSDIQASISISEAYISPITSLGSQDFANLSATFNVATAWELKVTNTAGLLVKSYSDTNAINNITVDGRDESGSVLTDGRYEIRLYSNGVLTYVTNIEIDNTLPVANIASPVNDDAIATDIKLITGSAADLNISTYVLEVADGLSPLAGDYEVLITNSSSLSNTALYTWILEDANNTVLVLPGDKTLRLTVTDKAGNTASTLVTVFIDTFGIINVSQNLVTINSMNAEEVTIDFTLVAAGTVTLDIAEELTGIVIRTISQSYLAGGTYQLPWDGKDDAGQFVADEAYIYLLSVNNGSRQNTYVPPLPSASGNSGNDLINYSVNDNNYWKIELNVVTPARVTACFYSTPGNGGSGCIININNNEDYKIDGVPYENGQQWIYWDGRDYNGAPVDSASYSFFFTAGVALPTNTIIVKGTTPDLAGEGVVPDIEIKSNPFLLTHSYEQVSTINYTVNQNSNVTVKILPPGVYDPNDPAAMILINNQSLNAEISPEVLELHSFEWRGYDPDAVPLDTNNINVSAEGQYTYIIEAISQVTGFSTMRRGALTLYQ